MDLEEEEENDFRTPNRRGSTVFKPVMETTSGIPLPGSSIPVHGNRRQSAGRRISTGIASGRQSAAGVRKLGDLGETF